jgi:sugar phosphate isomerase/epimerase
MKNRMIRYGVSTMFFHEYTLPDIFSFCSRAGLDTLEFWFETPDFWLKGLPLPYLSKCLGEYPRFSPVTCHMPILDLNPCSINPRVAEATLLYATECFVLAERAGASVYTIHPGRRTAKRPPTQADFTRFDRFIDQMHTISQGTPVTVAIENMEPAVNSLLCTPERMREILDREPWLSFTLDVSHAMSVSTDEAVRYVQLCSDRLATIHMSVPGAGGKLHYPVNKSPEITSLLKALEDTGFSGVITFEFEDRNFGEPLTAEEKINIVSAECKYLRERFGVVTG